METQETPAPQKSVLPYVIGVVLIVLLAAAAFIAVRYFRQPKGGPVGLSVPGEQVISFAGPGGGEAQTFALDIEPAKELPATQPDEIGMFVERKDNSVFIGTGEISVIVEAKPGEAPQADSDFSGPKVEVVVSPDTIIYRDTTKLDPENPGATVQQTVEVSTIDEITEQSSISVWGRKAGDRVIADVIVFSTPFMMLAPEASQP
ncbi:MAG TPA: hypothetical protein VFQ23_18885 [Anaerolineales bacterium]|nr:hypothetical protein [Anaerolineales bacterium]